MIDLIKKEAEEKAETIIESANSLFSSEKQKFFNKEKTKI